MVESYLDGFQAGVGCYLRSDVSAGSQVFPGFLVSIPWSWNASDSSPFWVTWQMNCHWRNPRRSWL